MEQEKRVIDPPSAIPEKKRGFYLPALDALRGIACFLIVAVHLEQHKIEANLPHVGNIGHLYNIGRPGLMMFFVLSGFLITLLLLKERDKTNTISFKTFYLKRILRIWPLYYLVLIGSAIIWQYQPPMLTFVLYMTILPNIAYYLGMPWETSPPQWSVGVEEQFYLFWPLIIYYLRRHMVPVLAAGAIAYTLLPHFLMYGLNHLASKPEALIDFTGRFFYGTKFNFLALGGIAACFYHRGYRPALLKNPVVSNAVLIVPFILWFTGYYPPYFGDEMHAVLFVLLIYHLSAMERPPYLLTNPVAVYIGKISYGIYMYHYAVLMLCFEFFLKHKFGTSLQYNLVAYAVVYGATLGTAALSYHTFEAYFLRLKDRLHPKKTEKALPRT